jgi:hypothetical protein
MPDEGIRDRLCDESALRLFQRARHREDGYPLSSGPSASLRKSKIFSTVRRTTK